MARPFSVRKHGFERGITDGAIYQITVEPERVGEALERLAAFEDLVCGLEAEQKDISLRLEQLRGERKEKTVQFRELLARKLVNNNMQMLLERARLK